MSIKIKTSWTDNNVIVEGVRIYKSTASFDINTLPAIYVEILDGGDFYEDFNVIEGQIYFYMLSFFLGEQEVFTECFEVKAEFPIYYSDIYIIGSASDNTTNSLLSEAISSIGHHVYVETWDRISMIPDDCKIIIAPHITAINSEHSIESQNALISKFNSGIPLLLAAYSDDDSFPSMLGLATSFADSSGISIDIVANTVLGAPYHIAQPNFIVRESSYYMAGMAGVSENAKTIAMKDSTRISAILQKGAINKNGLPSPANIAFAGFAWTTRSQLLSESGKSLLREIVKKTMR